MPTNNKPWYAGENQDALFYLLIAIFFIELIVGGIAFFYGIIHAAPETPDGPPVARFPWLAWGATALLAPVALLLVVHLAGSWLSHALMREEAAPAKEQDSDKLPDGMKKFYASVRHAPTIVVLVAILLLGMCLFFVEGALSALMELGKLLIPYIPWLAGSIAGLLAICFIVHALMVFRQRKMECEMAWRREILEKTGMVIVDKNSVALPVESSRASILPANQKALDSHDILDIKALPQDKAPDE